MRRSACLEAARQFLLRKLEHGLCGGIACGKGCLSEKAPKRRHPGRRSRSGTSCRKVPQGPRAPLTLRRGGHSWEKDRATKVAHLYAGPSAASAARSFKGE